MMMKLMQLLSLLQLKHITLLVKKALLSKKHVFVEKTNLCSNMSEASELIENCKKE